MLYKQYLIPYSIKFKCFLPVMLIIFQLNPVPTKTYFFYFFQVLSSVLYVAMIAHTDSHFHAITVNNTHFYAQRNFAKPQSAHSTTPTARYTYIYIANTRHIAQHKRQQHIRSINPIQTTQAICSRSSSHTRLIGRRSSVSRAALFVYIYIYI